jgi:hypothetical protein
VTGSALPPVSRPDTQDVRQILERILDALDNEHDDADQPPARSMNLSMAMRMGRAALRVGHPPEPREELDEFAETKAGLRSHIAKFWKDDGPNQKIRLSLPRWLWDNLLARTVRGGGPPREPTEEAAK